MFPNSYRYNLSADLEPGIGEYNGDKSSGELMKVWGTLVFHISVVLEANPTTEPWPDIIHAATVSAPCIWSQTL